MRARGRAPIVHGARDSVSSMSTADERGPKPAGMREVAQRAGVSTQTVSRVLNGHPHIREETRARVSEAIAALDYRVNNAARTLGTARTRTLGVIASDPTLYGPAAGIAALESAARAHRRRISTAYANAEDAASVAAALAHVHAQGVDGIILVGAHGRTLEVPAQTPGRPRHLEAAARRTTVSHRASEPPPSECHRR